MVNDNPFQIEEPNEWNCWLRSIHDGLLWLSLTNPASKQRMFIMFENFLYFDGPSSWRGAQFEIATADECLQVARTSGSLEIQPMTDDDVINRFRLFKLLINEGRFDMVKIIASNGVVRDQPDQLFSE